VHTYNPNYSSGRDWKDCGSRPVRAKSYQDPISTNKLGMMVHPCNPSYLEGIGRICGPRMAWAKSWRPYLKNKNKRYTGVAQVVEPLPSMHKALVLIPSIEKKKN
jgi:hypothetical protein